MNCDVDFGVHGQGNGGVIIAVVCGKTKNTAAREAGITQIGEKLKLNFYIENDF